MPYQRCTRCIMDNSSDQTIRFDSEGHCNYCTGALEAKKLVYFPNAEGKRRLEIMLHKLKREGKGKPYDYQHTDYRTDKAGALIRKAIFGHSMGESANMLS